MPSLRCSALRVPPRVDVAECGGFAGVVARLSDARNVPRITAALVELGPVTSLTASLQLVPR